MFPHSDISLLKQDLNDSDLWQMGEHSTPTPGTIKIPFHSRPELRIFPTAHTAHELITSLIRPSVVWHNTLDEIKCTCIATPDEVENIDLRGTHFVDVKPSFVCYEEHIDSIDDFKIRMLSASIEGLNNWASSSRTSRSPIKAFNDLKLPGGLRLRIIQGLSKMVHSDATSSSMTEVETSQLFITARAPRPALEMVEELMSFNYFLQFCSGRELNVLSAQTLKSEGSPSFGKPMFPFYQRNVCKEPHLTSRFNPYSLTRTSFDGKLEAIYCKWRALLKNEEVGLINFWPTAVNLDLPHSSRFLATVSILERMLGNHPVAKPISDEIWPSIKSRLCRVALEELNDAQISHIKNRIREMNAPTLREKLSIAYEIAHSGLTDGWAASKVGILNRHGNHLDKEEFLNAVKDTRNQMAHALPIKGSQLHPNSLPDAQHELMTLLRILISTIIDDSQRTTTLIKSHFDQSLHDQ